MRRWGPEAPPAGPVMDLVVAALGTLPSTVVATAPQILTIGYRRTPICLEAQPVLPLSTSPADLI